MITAGEEARSALRRAADRPMVWDGHGRARTGTQLDDRVRRLAGALTARGWHGGRLGLWMWNSPAALEAHLAVERLGATRVPVDPGAPAEEAKAVFDAAQVAGVIIDGEHADAGLDAILHDDDHPASGPGEPGPVEVSESATHILYPRFAARDRLLAVPLSYGNWSATMDINLNLYRSGWYGSPLASDDVYITVQQILHGTGLVGTFPFLLAGLPQVLLRRFEAGAFFEACARHAVTSTFVVPGMITRILAALEDHPDDSVGLRRILYGGAPFPVHEMRAAISRLGPILVQLYGRFEGGWPLTVLGTQDHERVATGDDRLARSCGRAISGVELDVKPVGDTDAGELRVRGPMVVAEYADPDGWCGLGDLVTVDEEGHYYLHGRIDGMINTGSYHVYPAEVEAALAAIPGVEAAQVRGEDDPQWGQAVTAYVITGGDPGEESIRSQLRQRLAAYKVPKRIHFVQELPDEAA